jgi:hypothetical protein
LLALSLVACATGDVESRTETSEITALTAPLTGADFARPIDKAFLRGSNANLADVVFEKKWAASHESASKFFRAYPGGYHEDLAQVAPARVPGREDLCFGDAHPHNFGFLEVSGRTALAFNDLDDAGYCFVAVDAAHYFAELHLAFDDKVLEAEVLEQYVDTLKDASRAKTLRESLVPSLQSLRASRLAKARRGDRLLLEDGLVATPLSERAVIEVLFRNDPRFRSSTILDVATEPRYDGGSAGLRRYHVLVSRRSGQTILELKEAAQPGCDLGRHTRTLSFDERLDILESAFWGAPQRDDYFYVDLRSTRFLVFDRLAKKSIDLDELTKSDRMDVLEAQASLMALRHAVALQDVKKDDIRAWLSETSKLLAKRWATASGVH